MSLPSFPNRVWAKAAAGAAWMIQGLHHSPALVLNADFRPLSYFPLSVCSWQDAVRAVFLKRVQVVSVYDDQVVRSPSFEMALPSVIALKEYVPLSRHPAFTRYNVFLRDRFACQYCGVAHSAHNLTFDHVIPRCRGGRTTWKNVVAACLPCNLRKGSLVPAAVGMQLICPPIQPTMQVLQRNAQKFRPETFHQTWRDFLYWDSELETV